MSGQAIWSRSGQTTLSRQTARPALRLTTQSRLTSTLPRLKKAPAALCTKPSLVSTAKAGSRSADNSFILHRMIQQATLYQLQPGMAELAVLVITFTQKMDFDTSTNFTLLFQWITYAEQLLATLPENERGHEA